MTQAIDALLLDLLEWIARAPRSHAELIETWRTSCPRLTIWEDAVDQDLVARATLPGRGGVITLTERGVQLLREQGRSC